MVLLGYRRTSRVGDRKETLISPELQAEVITRYAGEHGLEVEMLPAELDVSGGKVSRPILDEAIARVEQGGAAGLIVDTLDRFSRINLFDALRVIHHVESAGGRIVAVSENYDDATPEGRMTRNIFLSLGELQRERYGLKIAASKRSAVRRGIWPTHVVPIGYRMVARPERKNGPLEPDPHWAPIVVRAFELRAGGAAWREVGDLIDRGLSGASKVIANRVYLGEISLRVAGELVVNREAHEPLVSHDLWEAAQVKHPRPAHKAHHAPALLAKVARCAGCRGSLTRSTSGGWVAYRCSSRRAGGACPSRALISCALLDDYVQRIAMPHLHELATRSFERAEATGAIEADIETEERDLEALLASITAAGMSVDRAAAAIRAKTSRIDSLLDELARERARAGAGVLERDLTEIWDELSVERRGQVLRGALGVIWVWKGTGPLEGRVKVIADGFEPDELPRPGGKRYAVDPVAWSDDLAPGELRLVDGQDAGQG